MSFAREFLTEKGLINKVVQSEHEDGSPNIISIDFIVKLIENSDEESIKKVNETLVAIDESNLNIMDYMRHLARGIVE